MNYLFRDQWYDVPAYSPYHECLLVSIEYSLPLIPVKPLDQRIMENSWQKVWRFILAEGPLNTIRKVQSKRLQEFLNGDHHVVVAVGKIQGSGEPVVCVGTRHPRSAGVMLFRRELTKPLAFVPSEVAFARAVEDTVIALGLQQSSWDSAAGYDFYSDLAPPQLAVNFVPTIVSLIEANARGPASSLNGAEESDVASRYHPIRPPAAEARHQRKVTTEGALVIGAGDYARTQIIPALKRAGVPLHTVVDLEPYLAEHVRRRFGFARASTDWREAISQPETQIVIIASYHDSHAEIAATALRAGKKVFLEKPPAVTRGDLACLMEFVETPNSFLEVGYNRRFAPFTRRAKEFMSEAPGPTSITCLVKEVEIPDQHWYRWPKEGTRITGNLCHWIDLAVYFLGVSCEPSEMTITGPNLRYADDEKGVNVVFRDGSSLTIITSSRGDGTLGVQEFIEIRRGGLTIKIQDYRQLVATTGGSILCRLGSLRNKGHSAMYRESIARMRKNLPALYTSRELELTTLMTIKATEMIRNGSRSAAL